ncbi:MAG TPA: DUF1835 domain-containing protein [Flavobacteriaceae bacterium]|nr:DUF1835 domain-containing protein [Flavobacteriaceae bacterium]
MTKTLHILNGDSTAEIFSKSSLKGDILVWREMLCEGALHKDVGCDEFWIKRYTFFKEIGVSKLEYYDKTIKELVQLEDVSQYNEIVLWFEYDLFCQINLMGLCSYLLQSFRKKTLYSLVCTGHKKGKQNLQTLSDYSPEDYKVLYENKVKLTQHDLLFAETSWQVYVENNKEKLKTFNFAKKGKFQYLQQAIHQHLQRFPNENRLNQIDNKILEIINTEPSTKKGIIKKLLLWQRVATVYGFGDSQYYRSLEKLSDYYIIVDNLLFLNDRGEELI